VQGWCKGVPLVAAAADVGDDEVLPRPDVHLVRIVSTQSLVTSLPSDCLTGTDWPMCMHLVPALGVAAAIVELACIRSCSVEQ
jgi:hypothetical protein